VGVQGGEGHSLERGGEKKADVDEGAMTRLHQAGRPAEGRGTLEQDPVV